MPVREKGTSVERDPGPHNYYRLRAIVEIAMFGKGFETVK